MPESAAIGATSGPPSVPVGPVGGAVLLSVLEEQASPTPINERSAHTEPASKPTRAALAGWKIIRLGLAHAVPSSGITAGSCWAVRQSGLETPPLESEPGGQLAMRRTIGVAHATPTTSDAEALTPTNAGTQRGVHAMRASGPPRMPASVAMPTAQLGHSPLSLRENATAMSWRRERHCT